MAYKKITITDDHIKLLQAIKFESFIFDGDSRNGRFAWGIDQYAPWGGNFPIEEIALILGHWDDAIPESIDDYDGRKFPTELQNKFHDLYDDITENMEFMFGFGFGMSTLLSITMPISFGLIWNFDGFRLGVELTYQGAIEMDFYSTHDIRPAISLGYTF
jgi:hypothetical protein